MLQWTQGYIYIFKLMFLFSSYKNPQVILLDCMAALFLIFWRIASFPYWLHQFAIPPSVKRAPFSLHPHQHLFVDFLMIPTLTSVRWVLILVLICISLMISNVEHFMSVGMSSLEKCLIKSLPFFYWIKGFWCSGAWVPRVLWILTPYWMCHLQIPSLTQ